jgi:hypothetical protein
MMPGPADDAIFFDGTNGKPKIKPIAVGQAGLPDLLKAIELACLGVPKDHIAVVFEKKGGPYNSNAFDGKKMPDVWLERRIEPGGLLSHTLHVALHEEQRR